MAVSLRKKLTDREDDLNFLFMILENQLILSSTRLLNSRICANFAKIRLVPSRVCFVKRVE